jgi:hypothetical protein
MVAAHARGVFRAREWESYLNWAPVRVPIPRALACGRGENPPQTFGADVVPLPAGVAVLAPRSHRIRHESRFDTPPQALLTFHARSFRPNPREAFMSKLDFHSWANTVSAAVAAGALLFSIITVSCGPDSIRGRMNELKIQDQRAACAEGLVAVSALSSGIHDSTVADERKNAFRAFRHGKMYLLEDRVLTRTFLKVDKIYTEEDEQEGRFRFAKQPEFLKLDSIIRQARLDTAYRVLRDTLRDHAKAIGDRCKELGQRG